MSVVVIEKQLDLGTCGTSRALVLRDDATQAGAPIVLHLHGGAFTAGCARSGTAVATLLAEAGTTVIMTDYPLAPANPFPAGIDHVFRVLKLIDSKRSNWEQRKSPLLIAGEEAGGNLAAAAAMMARDQRTPHIAGQILIAPMLDPSMGTGSMRAAEAGPVGCCWADGWRKYLGSASKADHPYASPVNASRLAGLAPALIVTAQDDLMHDEALAYAERLRAAGVITTSAELTAPTGWPATLQARSVPPAPWVDALRDQFLRFLESLVVGPRVAAHANKI
jgi:acetyl esterase/lipase